MKIVPLILVLLLSVQIAMSQNIQIVQNGKSDFVIIVPKQSGNSDSIAAIYLQQYILQMTGVSVPIFSDDTPERTLEISIGATNRLGKEELKTTQNLHPDGYFIRPSNNKIHILGGSNKGSIYGVITLLENWGCRKFSPGEAFVPTLENLSLSPVVIRDEPKNDLRIINGRMTNDPEYVDWLRITTIKELSPPGYYVHTFERLVPRAEYFGDHPEYYAWLGNKYSFDQLCPSNPEVEKLIIKRLGEEMQKYPEYDIWSVSQNDNFTYCRCNHCSQIIEEEGSPAGPLIRLVNNIAAAFPNKTISTLAYQFSRPAPGKTKPADNVMVMLCTIELNRSRPIETDSLSQSFVKDITEWGKICKNIYLWDYTINFNHSISPFPNLHVLQPNLQFFYENNVRKQFPQSNLLEGLELVEYRGRLLAALLWDPYINLDSVKTDFLHHFYGDAAPFIKTYSEKMESDLKRSGKILYIYEPPNNHSEGYLSAEKIAEYNRLFDEAEKAVADKPKIMNRVKIARLPLQYAMMEIGKNDMFGARGWYLEKDGKFILRDDMKNTLEEFYAVCQANRFITLNERNLSPKTYYESTLRFIDVQVEGNFAFRKPVTTEPSPEKKYARGDPSVLTDGVQGAHDFNVHWLGWWGKDASITVDLEKPVQAEVITIGALWDGRSWILHPSKITCLVSEDGKEYRQIGIRKVEGDQQYEPVTRKFEFKTDGMFYRYVKFEVLGFGNLPHWHASEGEPAWFFVDEITVN
jgi:hypothetical protein